MALCYLNRDISMLLPQRLAVRVSTKIYLCYFSIDFGCCFYMRPWLASFVVKLCNRLALTAQPWSSLVK